MEIQTRRLVLRAPRGSEAEELAVIRHSEYVMKQNCMEPVTVERLAASLEKAAQEGGRMLLTDRVTGAVLGEIDWDEDDVRYKADALTLSYYLDEKCAGQGLMTEALRGLIPVLLEEKQVKLLSARVFADNPGSRRVLEKLGFVHEGTLRQAVRSTDGRMHDDMLFSLMREEWKQ